MKSPFKTDEACIDRMSGEREPIVGDADDDTDRGLPYPSSEVAKGGTTEVKRLTQSHLPAPARTVSERRQCVTLNGWIPPSLRAL